MPEARDFQAIEVSLECPAVGPWAVRQERNGGDVPSSLRLGEPDEFGPRLGPTSVKSMGIPDEMSDSEGGKLLSLVPVGQSTYGSSRFILPYFHANRPSLGTVQGDAAGTVPGHVLVGGGSSGTFPDRILVGYPVW